MVEGNMFNVLKKYEGLANSFEVTTASMENELKNKVTEIKQACDVSKSSDNFEIIQDLAM